METTIAAIPITAWQQAVIVVLFVVFVIALLYWFTGQQKSWQEFICKRDEQWQAWLNNRDREHNNQLSVVAQTLEKLRNKLDEHDDKVDKRINDVRSAANEPKTGRRPKVQP